MRTRMDGLLFLEETDYKLSTMIVAFAGWPDAAEAATGAVKYVAAQRGAGDAFDSELAQAIGLRSEITSYVTQLEQRYDATVDPSAAIPSPSAMVEEMEEFLRQQRGYS